MVGCHPSSNLPSPACKPSEAVDLKVPKDHRDKGTLIQESHRASSDIEITTQNCLRNPRNFLPRPMYPKSVNLKDALSNHLGRPCSAPKSRIDISRRPRTTRPSTRSSIPHSIRNIPSKFPIARERTKGALSGHDSGHYQMAIFRRHFRPVCKYRSPNEQQTATSGRDIGDKSVAQKRTPRPERHRSKPHRQSAQNK
ncbi:hypothetical protein GQ607_015176 [Colletotrichum asianum]|uniref:Uncharacterized protein n=1 Tax=Colletotrichum asianum TaxID=702518 RepID=A0A8H3W143_9PEZI|nr:hypothetical protein GQ607_015176 [Colletotrichum asianum]